MSGLRRSKVDGIDRQRWLHTDAVSEFVIRREEKSRTPSESIDTADFVVVCVARAASGSLELLQGVGDKSASPRQKLRVQAVALLIGLYDEQT
jgi:hypothetical protein